MLVPTGNARRQLERNGRWLLAIGVFVLLAGASAVYILAQQQVTTPFDDRYVVRAEFEHSSGLEPGLGQPVNVAGVRVGKITAAELRDGRSLVDLQIDPDKVPHVYADARATLFANTPLKDMQVELAPGRPPARELPDGGVIPLSRTAPADRPRRAARDARPRHARVPPGADRRRRARRARARARPARAARVARADRAPASGGLRSGGGAPARAARARSETSPA